MSYSHHFASVGVVVCVVVGVKHLLLWNHWVKLNQTCYKCSLAWGHEIFLIWCRSINRIIQHDRQVLKCIFIGQLSNLFFSETIMSMNLISSVNDVWMVLCEVSSISADSKSNIMYHFINRWRYCWQYPISLEFGISIKLICIFNRCRQYVFYISKDRRLSK